MNWEGAGATKSADAFVSGLRALVAPNWVLMLLLYLNLYLLSRPDRGDRPLSLWDLGGGFSDPFCHVLLYTWITADLP
jgi:hypothetical protein